MHTAPWKLQLCCTLTSGRCYDLSYDWTQEMFFWVLKAVHSQRWNWIMSVLVKATLGTVSKPRATTCPRGEIQEWRGHNDKGLTWHPGTVDVTLCRRRETGWELCYSSLTERQRPTLLASCLEEHNASGSVTVIWAVFKTFCPLDFTKLPAGFCLCWDSSVPLRHTLSNMDQNTLMCESVQQCESVSISCRAAHAVCVWVMETVSRKWAVIQWDHSHTPTALINMVTAQPADLCEETHEDQMQKNMIIIIILSS